MEKLAAQGAIFVDELDQVPNNSVVVFSAHGVSPSVRESARRKSLIPIDATCPLVAKAHQQARRPAQKGHRIILIGHQTHEEVEARRTRHLAQSKSIDEHGDSEDSTAPAGRLAVADRGHGAMYDGLNHSLIYVGRLRRELVGLPLPRFADRQLVLAVDVSPWLRSDAACSPGRLFYHVYGRAKSASHFNPGWPYSLVAVLEPSRSSWTQILDVVRLGRSTTPPRSPPATYEMWCSADRLRPALAG